MKSNLISPKHRRFIEQNAWMVGGNILFAVGVNMIVTEGTKVYGNFRKKLTE